MTRRRTSHILLILMSICQVTVAQTGNDFKLLHDELFTTRSYQKSILPRARTYKPIYISLEFHLRGIIYLDELEERLATTAHLTLQWNDTFLTWNERHFNNITYTYMPQNDVWKPDISLHNGFTKLKELGDDVILMKIYSSGRIVWKPFEVFETKCDMDVTKFPFDQQICKLIFRMWASEPKDLKFELKDSDALITDSYDQNGVWDLRSSKIELTLGSVIISLTLDRRPEYFLLTLICPIILLSFLSIFTFVIPVDSGEKMGYSMTVYLAFAVLLTIFGTSVPVNSRTTSYLAVYLIGLLIKGTLIVMVTAVQVRLHQQPNDDPLPLSVQRFIKVCRGVLKCFRRRVKSGKVNVIEATSAENEKYEKTSCSSSPNLIEMEECSQPTIPSDASNADKEDKNEMFTWSDLTSTLDWFFFGFFSVVAVILPIVFFVAAL